MKNPELLEKVIDAIEEYPALYDQGLVGIGDPRDPCGTACCIAGWAVALGPPNTERLTKITYANKMLGLPHIRLLEVTWPMEWFERAGLQVEPDFEDEKTPNASEAVTILRMILEDGEFWE